MIIATAARWAHAIGLHLRLDKCNLADHDLEHRHNLFWIVYLLEKGLSMRTGRPSCINDEDITVDLPPMPTDKHGDPRSPDLEQYLFPSMARLARIDGKILTELYAGRQMGRSRDHELCMVAKLDTELQKWKEYLPLVIRPEAVPYETLPNQSVCLTLHFAYYNSLSIIHLLLSRVLSGSKEPC